MPASSIAPLAAGYGLLYPNMPGPMRGASNTGVPLLPAELDNAWITIEVAWGADPTANEELWTWADITTDLRYEPGLSFRYGRGDEASSAQPANCAFTLTNSDGAYSQGGESRNFPNVHKGLPVRVRIDPDGTGDVVVFQGNIIAFRPQWADQSGVGAAVAIQAAGALKRLQAGKKPVKSVLARSTLAQPGLMGYWTCEVGERATQAESSMGHTAIRWSGSPTLASNRDFIASDPLPVLKKSVWYAAVNRYPETNFMQVRLMLEFGEGNEADGSVMYSVYATGSIRRWDVFYSLGGGIGVRAYDRFNALVNDTGPVGFNAHGTPRQRRWSLEITQVGADLLRELWNADAIEFGHGGGLSGTVVGQTIGSVTHVVINPQGALDNVAWGHLSVQNVHTDVFTDRFALQANSKEKTTDRFRRLCDENSVKYQQFPSPPTAITSSTYMGPQSSGTLPSLLGEIEKADQGIIFDGMSNGLVHVSRDYRETQARIPLFTVDVGAGELHPTLEAPDDDQRMVNKAVITRKGGATAEYEDVSGPLGTRAVGAADVADTINMHDDDNAPLYASWSVGLGTVEGYRYPSINLNIRANPRFARLVLGLLPGSRIDLINIRSALPDHPANLISLTVEGVAMQISPRSVWTVTLVCSPSKPWRVAVWDNPSSNTGNDGPRWDTSGSRTVGTTDLGATTLTVETTVGPIWTTLADDFPVELSIGGIKTVATNIVGASSPQTFTIEPMARALPGGSPVQMWECPPLGLGSNL